MFFVAKMSHFMYFALIYEIKKVSHSNLITVGKKLKYISFNQEHQIICLPREQLF